MNPFVSFPSFAGSAKPLLIEVAWRLQGNARFQNSRVSKSDLAIWHQRRWITDEKRVMPENDKKR